MFLKVAEYKIITQKSTVFLYTSNEKLKSEIKTNPFTIASKNKILRNKFNKI